MVRKQHVEAYESHSINKLRPTK